jgi:replicative DNA helicase
MPSAAGSSGRVDRVPPHSEEAERGVLGSALLDSGRVIDLCLERRLAPEAFYFPAHRTIFETLIRMRDENRAVDLLTTSERLRDLKLLDELGGGAFLERLIDGTPTAAHAEYYIEIVRQKHLLRRVIEQARESIDACYNATGSADLILDEAEQRLFDISDLQNRATRPWSHVIKEAMQVIERIIQEKRDITGLATGFSDLDRMTKGFQPSDMIIIAARPSMGKTSLAMNIAENVALGHTASHEPKPVAIFSLEMSTEQLVKRLLCSRAHVPSHKLSGGYISNEYHMALVNAASELQGAPIFVDDSAGLSAPELRARARRLKQKHGIALIVIDYLQMMNYRELADEGRQREVAAISSSMKAMAKELKVPVLVLSQLNRAPEARGGSAIPRLSDLRESGSIEQDADVVAMLRRPCKYPDDPETGDKTLAILDLAKQRNGPTGEIRLNFIEELTRFQDRAREGVDQRDTVAPSHGGL